MSEEIETRTTASRFYLTCKVVKKKFSYKDLQSRNKTSNQTAESIILVPEQTTECDLFLNAWLPPQYTPDELKLMMERKIPVEAYHEIVMETGMPVNGYFRGALTRADFRLDRPHIFVMTHKAEQLLAKMEGKKIRVTVLGDGEEEALYELKAETRSPIEGMQ